MVVAVCVYNDVVVHFVDGQYVAVLAVFVVDFVVIGECF